MKPLKSRKPENDLRNTILYFAFFSFAPTFHEILTFFPQKISQKELQRLIDRQIAARKLVSYPLSPAKHARTRSSGQKKPVFEAKNSYLYTLPQYSMHFRNRAVRQNITETKLRRVVPYLKALSRLPIIRFIGITGSAAMDNCKKSADIDLCIVTAGNLLFTGRFLSILLALLFGVRNPRTGACLNLFLDERDLAVPKADRSLYTAHEVLQLKPYADKDKIHNRFLWANRWTAEFFPNAAVSRPKQTAQVPAAILQLTEPLLRMIQLRIIRKNGTGHSVTATQLWLFKHDFKMRLKSQ